MAEQLDKLSLKYVKLSPKTKAYAKHLHKRKLRRQAKTEDLNPMPNRYDGWIG